MLLERGIIDAALQGARINFFALSYKPQILCMLHELNQHAMITLPFFDFRL